MGERADRAAQRFLLLSLWTSAAVIAGVITWVAVARLGQEATGGSQTTLTQAEVRRELAVFVTPTPLPPGRRTTSPPPRSTTRPSSTQPSPTRPTSTTGSAPTTPTSTRPTTPTRSTPPHQLPRRFSSWTVNGGRVGADCRGDVIRIVYATPSDGWGMEVKDSGPDKVTVEFSRGDADSKVEASCSGGVPVLNDDD